MSVSKIDEIEGLLIQQEKLARRISGGGTYRPYQRLPSWAKQIGFESVEELNSALRAQAHDQFLKSSGLVR